MLTYGCPDVSLSAEVKIALLNICIKMQTLILSPFIKMGNCRGERINNALVCVPCDLKVLIEGLPFCLGKIIDPSY